MNKIKYTVATLIFWGLFVSLFPDNPGLASVVALVSFGLITLVSGGFADDADKTLEAKLVDRIIKLEDKVEATDVENRRLRSKLDAIDNSSL